jgi:GT2 family glycosyltransferase
LISVVVPTHNRLELLRKKLELLESQAGEFEVIVVADGCTDGTLGWLEDYKPRYPLQVLSTAGLGSAGARNRGVEVAKGEIILLSDDDVMLQEGCVQAHLEAHGRTPAATVFVGRLSLPPELKNSGATSMYGPKAFWWNFTGNNSSIAKLLWQQQGGFDENYQLYAQVQTGEDLDFGYRLSKAGVKFQFLPRAEAIHEAWSYKDGRALERAKTHGFSHVQLVKKHGDMRIAWALGVHPTLLAIKMALLPSLKMFMGYEGDLSLAHAWGASQAWNQPSAS